VAASNISLPGRSFVRWIKRAAACGKFMHWEANRTACRRILQGFLMDLSPICNR